MPVTQTTYKYWIKRILGISLILVLMAFLTASSNANYDLLTKNIVVSVDEEQGNRFVNEEEVKQLVFKYMGVEQIDKINRVNIASLEKVLEDEPQIQNAELYMSVGGKLHIDILQHNPVVRLIDQNKQTVYLSEKGFEFPVSNRFTARVPIATGLYDLNDYELVEKILKLAIAIYEDDFMYALTEQIVVDEDGLLSVIPIVGDFKIVFGCNDKIQDKIVKLKAFYKEGLNNGLDWSGYKAINVSFDKQVVCTRK